MAKNHIVLIEPEIPYNTGNIARTCVVTGTALHLVPDHLGQLARICRACRCAGKSGYRSALY